MRIIFLSLLFFIAKAYSQTCIIAIRSKNSILVGTDTRRSRFINKKINGITTSILKFDTVCKVGNFNNLYFSSSGLDIENAYSTSRKCAKINKTLAGTAATFKIERRKGIIKFIYYLKQKGLFEKYYDNLKGFSTIFYGIENDSAKIISVDFKITSNLHDPLKLNESISYFTRDTDSRIVMIGHYELASNLLSKALDTMSFIEAIKYSIEKQSESTPDSVSPPIEIFSINKNGINWFLNPINCKTTQ